LSDLPLGQHGSLLELTLLSLEAVMSAIMLLAGQLVLGVGFLAGMIISYVRF
jgi:hypothetical protein